MQVPKGHLMLIGIRFGLALRERHPEHADSSYQISRNMRAMNGKKTAAILALGTLTMGCLSSAEVRADPKLAPPQNVVLGIPVRIMDTNRENLDKAEKWIVSFIRDVAPPGRKIYYPEGQETEEEANARYESITQDILSVVYSPDAKPLFTGPYGRSKTVAVILSVMFHESSFMRHVDYGLGKYARGDEGKSVCLMQLYIGGGRTLKWNIAHNRPVMWNDPPEEISEGFTDEEVIQNRRLCIREGLNVLHVSFGGTKGMPIDDRLRIYASGSKDKGALASKNRMRKAMQWYAKTFHDQFTDEAVMEAVKDIHYTIPLPVLPHAPAPVNVL